MLCNFIIFQVEMIAAVLLLALLYMIQKAKLEQLLCLPECNKPYIRKSRSFFIELKTSSFINDVMHGPVECNLGESRTVWY